MIIPEKRTQRTIVDEVVGRMPTPLLKIVFEYLNSLAEDHPALKRPEKGIMKIIVSLCAVLLSLNLFSFELIPLKNVKIVIFTPKTHADIVRETMGKFGAGKNR